MTETSKNSEPSVAPSPEAELEQLFSAAESLTQQITGSVHEEEAAAPILAGEEPVRTETTAFASSVIEQPDAMKALDRTEADVHALKDLLTNPDAPTHEDNAASHTTPPSDEVADVAPLIQEVPLSETTSQKHAIAEAFEEPAPAPPHRRTIADLEEAAAKEEAEERAAAEQALAAKEAATKAQTATLEQPANLEMASKPSFGKRAIKGTVRLGKMILFLPPNLALSLVVLLDWPFRNWSIGVKKMLGMLGIITFLSGAAAWYLPGMLSHNPFESIPLSMTPEEPAPAEGEEAASSHGKKAPPAHGEEEASSSHSEKESSHAEKESSAHGESAPSHH